jgi:hypothetical protein
MLMEDTSDLDRLELNQVWEVMSFRKFWVNIKNLSKLDKFLFELTVKILLATHIPIGTLEL